MTDTFKDTYVHIRDRFRSPFIFSFISAWLIYNWKIIAVAGSDSLLINKIKAIEYLSHWPNTTSVPLTMALVFTLTFPITRNLIKAFYTWTRTWGENWNLSISKEGSVKVEKYIKLREQIDARTKTLEEVIKKESETILEAEENKTTLLQKENEINNLKNIISQKERFISDTTNFKYINGLWKCERYLKENAEAMRLPEKTLHFENGKCYEEAYDGSRNAIGEFKHYHYDNIAGTLFFVLEDKSQSEIYEDGHLKFTINDLKFNGLEELKGIENGTYFITYKKIR